MKDQVSVDLPHGRKNNPPAEKRSPTELTVEYILSQRHGAAYTIADRFGFSYIFNDYAAIPAGVSDAERNSMLAAREVIAREREALFNSSGAELLRIKCEEEDRDRFFSSPLLDAAAVYWARMSYWTIEEGVSLLLGKNPRKVSWEIMRDKLDQYSLENSPFVKMYTSILHRANKAVKSGIIGESLHPSSFLVWADGHGLGIPENLKTAVSHQLVSMLEPDTSLSRGDDSPIDPTIRALLEEWCALAT